MKHLYKILSECVLLLEYDAEKTWARYGDKINKEMGHHLDNSRHHPLVAAIDKEYTTHLMKSPETSANKWNELNKHHVLGHLEKLDPSPNKKYVPHMAKMLGAGINNFEDVDSRMASNVAKFHRLATNRKLNPEHTDMGRFKNMGEFEHAMEGYADVESNNAEARAYHEKMKSPEHSTTESHGSFTKIIPHTPEAAQHFGKGTRWCTATDKLENSMFDHYNKSGPMHILIPHSASYSGEKYQYHRSTKQLMNEKDEPVERSSLPHEMKHHLDLYDQHVESAKNNPHASKHHLEADVVNHYYANHAPKDEVDEEKSHWNNRGYVGSWASKHVDPKEFKHFITSRVDDDMDEHWDQVKHKYAHLEDDEDAYRDAWYNETGPIEENKYKAISHAVNNSPHYDSKTFRELVDGGRLKALNSDALISSSKIKGEDLHYAIDKLGSKVGHASWSVLNNKNHDESHTDKLLQNTEDSSADLIYSHGKISDNAIDKALSTGDQHRRAAVVLNPNVHLDHTKRALNDENHDVRAAARMRQAGVNTSNISHFHLFNNANGVAEPFWDNNWPNHPKNPANIQK
jgi:hypothetical protein